MFTHCDHKHVGLIQPLPAPVYEMSHPTGNGRNHGKCEKRDNDRTEDTRLVFIRLVARDGRHIER